MNNNNNNNMFRAELSVTAIDEVVSVIHNGLKHNFHEVRVEVVDCPDLKQPPFSLASSGISGNPILVDVGGVHNINLVKNHHAKFHLRDVFAQIGRPNAFIIGPGAGSNSVVGCNCELMANLKLCGGETIEKMNNNNNNDDNNDNNDNDNQNNNLSKVASLDKDGRILLANYSSEEIGVLANLFASDGLPGKVIEIEVSKRIKDKNFISCIREALAEHFGPQKPIGLGGVFIISGPSSRFKGHVMPDFASYDFVDPAQVEDWLQFFQIDTPATCLSTILSHDVGSKGFRLEHTHFFNDFGQGGHYHYDTTPETVHYRGYFSICQAAFRVSGPTNN